MKNKRTAFFVSDSTGITAKTLGQSLLTQFHGVEFEKVMLPYIDTLEKAADVVKRINAAEGADNAKPIIFDTIINKEIRKAVAQCDGFMVDIFATFLAPLEQELGEKSSYSVGQSHQASTEDESYKDRMDAVHYALDNDDGGKINHYDEADLILIGVSRSGKTPTSIYMALQMGIYVANYPITEEDMDDLRLPKILEQFKGKLFGLTIDPVRLSAIRNERKADSRYASLKQCDMEVRAAEAMFRRYGLPFVDTTRQSVEEISTRILVETNLK